MILHPRNSGTIIHQLLHAMSTERNLTFWITAHKRYLCSEGSILSKYHMLCLFLISGALQNYLTSLTFSNLEANTLRTNDPFGAFLIFARYPVLELLDTDHKVFYIISFQRTLHFNEVRINLGLLDFF